MKKLIISLLIAAPFITCAQDFDFRKTNWNFTKNQVKAAETSESIMDESNILGYLTTVAGLDCTLGYYFADNSLYKGAYIFSEEHSNKNDYLNDFAKLKVLLKEKYGEPQTDEVNWKNSLYQDDKEDYGLAISIGHLELYSIWETEKTSIQLIIDGDNYEINLRAIYSSKNLSEQVEKKNQKNVLDDL